MICKMRLFIIFTTLLHFTLLTAQETSLDNYTGDWGNSSSWVGGWTDGTPAFLSLPESNSDITIQGSINVGSTTTTQNLSFASNKDAYDFTVNDTLIVYGDVDFANKAMNLNLGNGAVFIILGDLDMNNKIDIASGGTLVVKGNFNKNGSQGSYTGDGNVYAGSFSGDAEATIDSNGDSSFTIDQLSDDGFSEIEDFVNGSGENPLPVELLFFHVSYASSVQLKWATASELNNDHFEIERSEDGIYFYEIGRVAGHGTTTEEHPYFFEDTEVIANTEYYHLKQVDYDGRFEYFEIKMVRTSIEDRKTKVVAHPTIVTNHKVHVSSSQPFVMKDITIVDLRGSKKTLSENIFQANPLSYEVSFTGLKKGVYHLLITTSEGNTYRSRMIVK